MVVGLASEYGVSPVELFNEKQAYELMGECHLGQRYFFVGQSVNRGCKAVRPSHDEYQTFETHSQTLLKPLREVHGAAFNAMLIKKHNVVAGLKLLAQGLAL